MKTCLALLTLAVCGTVLAQDVTRPAEVTGILGARVGGDVQFSWPPVTTDAAGQPETIDHYNIYKRGFGFVEMGNSEHASVAITALNGHTMDGRELTVNEAKERTSGGGGGGRY